MFTMAFLLVNCTFNLRFSVFKKLLKRSWAYENLWGRWDQTYLLHWRLTPALPDVSHTLTTMPGSPFWLVTSAGAAGWPDLLTSFLGGRCQGRGEETWHCKNNQGKTPRVLAEKASSSSTAKGMATPPTHECMHVRTRQWLHIQKCFHHVICCSFPVSWSNMNHPES